MNTPVIIHSSKPGPTAIILGGIHGNETCGVAALDLLKGIQIKRGKLILLYGNPRAIEQNKRFMEHNLNRMFLSESELDTELQNSYEFMRSREILPYLDEADYLLDIHSSATPGSVPFVICEPNGADIAQYFSHAFRCYGFATLEPGGTDGYMYRKGKVGLCIECGDLLDPATQDIAYDSALRFLASLDMYDYPLQVHIQQKAVEAYELYYTRTNNFRLAREFADFELLSAGDLIGHDGEQPVCMKKSARILFARNRSRIGDEGFVLVKTGGLWGVQGAKSKVQSEELRVESRE